MKIKITFKDPDCVHGSIKDALDSSRPDGLSDDEWETIREEREGKLDLSPFIEYSEYCTVEIDTEAKTAVVVPFK
jgi:hypothetical protein